MDSNALATPSPIAAGQGDIDWASPRWQQSPEGGGAAVAENCLSSGTTIAGGGHRQDACHPSPLVAGCDVSDCVYATVKAVQASRVAPLANR